MSKIVHISWINPSQNVDLYPAILDGMKIEHKIRRPTAELFFVATQAEAEELKTRMEQYIPKKSYSAHDEEGKPLSHVVSEPEVSILDIP
jgi:hypothetical protein